MQGGKNPSLKTSRAGDFGASLLNKLPAVSRKRRKRAADKSRRQAERRELVSESNDAT